MKCCQCVTLATAACKMRIIKITVFWVNLSWNLTDKAVSVHSHEAIILIAVKLEFSNINHCLLATW